MDANEFMAVSIHHSHSFNNSLIQYSYGAVAGEFLFAVH